MPLPFRTALRVTAPGRRRLPSAAAWSAAAGLCLALTAGTPAQCAQVLAAQDGDDLLALPLEKLLDLKVSTASKFEQRLSEAPSAVTVITARDIATFGYRTLKDVLRSIRSLTVTDDRNYSFLGVRGLSVLGDYNSRVLLLIDGHRVNDGVYGTAPIGWEFPLDVDLIDRVEFVPGPGSALFGSNAFFGVINVFTRSGRDIDGAEVAAAGGSYRSIEGRASYGTRYDNGAALLLSGTGFNSKGGDLYFPEFDSPDSNGGRISGGDYESAQTLFAKLDFEGLTLEAGTSRRKKGIPTASFGQVFGSTRPNTIDSYSFIAANLSRALSPTLQLDASADYWEYTYAGDYIYDPTGVTVNKDTATNRWASGELRLLASGFARHKIIGGGELRRDWQANQANYDESGAVYLDSRQTSNRAALFLQDEYSFAEHWILTAGLREDHDSSFGNLASPRAALVHAITPATTAKLLYGSAFRSPNMYEQYYVTSVASSEANPNLKPERIQTTEAILEHYLRSDWRVTGSLFIDRLRDVITYQTDPATGLLQYQNGASSRAHGVEAETERRWEGGARLRASVTWQIARDSSGDVRSDSPKYLAKLNYSVPVLGAANRIGIESQLTSARRTYSGGTVAGFGVTNLTLTSTAIRHVQLSASVYNIFDRRYDDPPSPDHVDALGRPLNAIPQYGRTWWLKSVYRFD